MYANKITNGASINALIGIFALEFGIRSLLQLSSVHRVHLFWFSFCAVQFECSSILKSEMHPRVTFPSEAKGKLMRCYDWSFFQMCSIHWHTFNQCEASSFAEWIWWFFTLTYVIIKLGRSRTSALDAAFASQTPTVSRILYITICSGTRGASIFFSTPILF